MKAEHCLCILCILCILPIFIFTNLSPASAAEISFDDTQTGVFTYANTHRNIGGFGNKADNPYYQMLDGNGIASVLQSENAAEITSKKQEPSISEGPLLVRPSHAASPPDSLFFSAFMLNMNTGILHLLTSDGPIIGVDDARPVTEIRQEDTHHNFFMSAPYASAYNIKAGLFSWPVNLDIMAIDGSNKWIEASGVSALVHLDSLNGQFTLAGQMQTLQGTQASLHLASQLTRDSTARPEAIAPILSLNIHGKDYRSGARLSVILPGNTQSDIAGQFDNFQDNHAERRLKIAGQFNSAPKITE